MSINVNGVVFCPFDGWKPARQANAREAINAAYAG